MSIFFEFSRWVWKQAVQERGNHYKNHLRKHTVLTECQNCLNLETHPTQHKACPTNKSWTRSSPLHLKTKLVFDEWITTNWLTMTGCNVGCTVNRSSSIHKNHSISYDWREISPTMKIMDRAGQRVDSSSVLFSYFASSDLSDHPLRSIRQTSFHACWKILSASLTKQNYQKELKIAGVAFTTGVGFDFSGVRHFSSHFLDLISQISEFCYILTSYKQVFTLAPVGGILDQSESDQSVVRVFKGVRYSFSTISFTAGISIRSGSISLRVSLGDEPCLLGDFIRFERLLDCNLPFDFCPVDLGVVRRFSAVLGRLSAVLGCFSLDFGLRSLGLGDLLSCDLVDFRADPWDLALWRVVFGVFDFGLGVSTGGALRSIIDQLS